MANSEQQFRKELLDQCKEDKRWAKGNSPENDVGRPDLISMLDVSDRFMTIWIELKFSRKGRGKSTLSTKQLLWQKRLNMAGGFCGWAYCRKESPTEWVMFAGIGEVDLSDENFIQRRRRGESWDVEKVLFTVYSRVLAWRNFNG